MWVRSLGAREGRRHGRGSGGVGMPGAAGLARPGMCPPAEGAGGGRVGRAGCPSARGHCGTCFTCGYGDPPLCATERRI